MNTSRQTAPAQSHSRKRLFLGVFVGLLLLSTVARFFVPAEGELLTGQQRTTVKEYDRDILTGGEVQIAYRDLPALNGDLDAPVVVLIHGSPVGSMALDNVLPSLHESCRLIVPDLPGFGGSTIDIPDYSTRAGAHYVLELLDKLGVEKAYFTGYSMGGGVILNIADIAPQRVEGLIMCSAIGVQERELLGNYALNHGIHGLQLGLFWLLQNFTPHFGYMDHGIFNVAYARNFYDTDQRPFRAIIQNYDGPMLIIQGSDDAMVTPVTAADHALLAKQPELVWTDGGHLQLLTEPYTFTKPMVDFIERVEQGNFASQSIDSETFPPTVHEPGYVFLMVLLAVGTLISEDLSCIIGGLLASQGTLPLWAAIAACALGIFIGDLMLYALGYLGKPALSRAPLKWFVTEKTIARMERWYHRRGSVIILTSRFVPGTRLPAYVAAGVLRMPLAKFVPYFLAAVLAWTPILVGLSYLAGDVVLGWVEKYDRFAIYVLIAGVFALWFFVHGLIPLLTWRGRRMLVSRWRRLTCWEYWPWWVLYLPVGLYVTWHGFKKYRCPPLFTAVNPAIPNGGGLVSESKVTILSGLAGAGEAVAVWTALPLQNTVEENLATLDAFMAERDLTFPVVLKPDMGERGEGVAIVHSREAARDYLQRAIDTTIAQAFAPGKEYGVFYYRMPGEEHGSIFGITDKRFTHVTGDGEHTLEWLILNDARAIAMAKFFLKKYEDRLEEIPNDGERVQLAELGTHCRGSLFLDGSHLATPELVATLDAISKSFTGFDFGRYDIRVPSAADLSAGRNLKVIEVNGLSSEATWIYDPKHSFFFGVKTLCQQWRIAFAIAALNHGNGHPHLPAREVFRLFFASRSRDKLEV